MTEIKVSRPIDAIALAALTAINKSVEQNKGYSAFPDWETRDALITDAAATAIIATVSNEPVGAIYFSSPAPDTVEMTFRGAMAFIQSDTTSDTTATLSRELLLAGLRIATEQNLLGLEIWLLGGNQEVHHAAIDAGMSAYRELLELEIPLPLAQDASLAGAKALSAVTLRNFVIGQDEEPWLVLNRRAFARDPDQGIWTRPTLNERMNFRWFDPEIFLIAEMNGKMVGTCWVQIHPDTDLRPQFGEIYVVGVDPDFQNQGLGRGLVTAGLDLIAQKDCRTGGLFVDSINTRAVELYRKIGFTKRRTDYALKWNPPSRSKESS